VGGNLTFPVGYLRYDPSGQWALDFNTYWPHILLGSISLGLVVLGAIYCLDRFKHRKTVRFFQDVLFHILHSYAKKGIT
jgi:hypothetical protein